MKAKGLITTIVVLTAAAAGMGGYYRFGRTVAPPEVTTLTVSRGDIAEVVGATGTIEAMTTVQVGSQVSGTIQSLSADFNSIVHKGEIVARLDPSLFETQTAQGRANLARAQADAERMQVALLDAQSQLKRSKELSGRGMVAAMELETSEAAASSAQAQVQSSQAQVLQARAALNQSAVNLQHTIIEAPIDGIVLSRNVDVGQTVAASMQAPTLFVIAADLTKLRVVADIDESDVARIRPGQVVRFRVDAYSGDEFTGIGHAGPAAAQGRAERRHLLDRDRRSQSAAAPETRHDRDREHRDRATSRCGPDPRRRAALPAVCRHLRGVQPGSARRPAELRHAGHARARAAPAAWPRAGRLRCWRRPSSRLHGSAGQPPGTEGRPANAPAQTVDALFAPLPVTVTSGRVWRFVGDRLQPVRVRLGISDGAYTELIAWRARARDGARRRGGRCRPKAPG